MPAIVPRNTFLIMALAIAAGGAIAQAPPAPAPGQQFPPLPKPSNLKVLPKDISTSELISLMKQFNSQLGVTCGYCHAGPPGSYKLNFASDAKPEKNTARIMMTMTNEINSKYVGNLPTGSDMKVNCGTCHRGHPEPEDFVAPPGEPGKP